MRFRTIALILAIPILIGFTAFVINQTNQVVQFASNLSPTLGQLVLWLLLASYAIIVIVPVVLIVRLPTPLRPPTSDSGPEFERHLRQLQARLVLNRRLGDRPVETREDVEAALVELGKDADTIIKETASIIFLTTAISQNGRLDGLVVLAAQTRMVWRIAHVYYQRPSVRDMLNLYANVATAAFVAAQLEDINVEEQIEPVVEAMAGAAIGAVPGMAAAATILSSSILTGSTNAFLTLRVGIITRRYCGSLVVPPRPSLRRLAAAEAARMLLPLVWEGSRKVSNSVFQALRKRVGRKMFGVGKEAASDAKRADPARGVLATVNVDPETGAMAISPLDADSADGGVGNARPWWHFTWLFGGTPATNLDAPPDADATPKAEASADMTASPDRDEAPR